MGKPKKILVVDDERLVRASLQRILQRDGHLVETAENGQEAIQKFTATKYDLVISDCNMPGMKGDQLVQVLKQHDPSISVVMFTANPPMEKLPAVDCLIQKPVSMQELLSQLAPFLGTPSGQE